LNNNALKLAKPNDYAPCDLSQLLKKHATAFAAQDMARERVGAGGRGGVGKKKKVY
jgi:hypothetical protein